MATSRLPLAALAWLLAGLIALGLAGQKTASRENSALLTRFVGEIRSQWIDASGESGSKYDERASGDRVAGERFDAITNRYYLRARHYDPRQGRFASADRFPGKKNSPITQNKYVYANANPANNIDPAGTFSLMTGIGITLAIVAVPVGAFFGAQALDKREHFYYNETPICLISGAPRSKCGPMLTFYHLRRFPAPGADGSRVVNTGSESFALPVGWVTHVVNEAAMTVTNVTQRFPIHLLDPGTVVRGVRSIGNQILVTSQGRGSGRFASFNVETAGWLWKRVDQNIINEIE